MKKSLSLILSLALTLFSCAFAADFSLEAKARKTAEALVSGQYAEIIQRSNETVCSAVNENLLAQTWIVLQSQMGDFSGIDSVQINDAAHAAGIILSFANGNVVMNIAFDSDNLISALTLQPVIEYTSPERAPSDGADEAEIILFEGTDIALSGRIIRPANASGSTPYVILAQGSGPSDMDETFGPNKPFRDIAYGLASLGIGSLRFDKITYSHPEHPIKTVSDEYLKPIREAARVLKNETNAQEIYLIGHSLGGMLTPWLVQECDFDGGISLAGTPKALWEISYDQNLLTLEYAPEEQRSALMEQVESERKRAEALMDMSPSESADATIFGISAVYQRSIAELDELAIAKATGKPYLFLWGKQDFQVNAGAFSAWEDGLGNEGPYTYIAYEKLNHLFMPAAEGDSIMNVQAAYSRPAEVSESVVADIAAWINGL